MDEDAHRRTLPAPPLDSDATYIPVRPGAGAAPSPDPRSTLARLDPRGGSTLPAAGPPRALTEQPWAPYQVLGELGRGGMGLVYRARQKELGREVALKQVISERPELHQKFLLEARLTGQLEHPNIVPVYDLLRGVEGEVALAMKLVHGREWSAILRPAAGEAPRDLDFHLGVLLSVSNAVGFAHSRGVTHNDLKPANVMVGEFGEVLLMDWGIAYDVRELPEPPLAAPHRSTMDGASGTPVYMAPELAMGDGSRLGPWTDVYLLGAILFEIVTGAPPHTGEDVGQVIRAAVLSEPKPFPPGAPRGLEAICHKAMARDPDHRYPDVKSLQATLEKKSMRAPFTGRVGIRTVNLGQFLDRGNPIVTLQALDPIHVDFWLPQQRVPEIKVGYTVRLAIDARPGVVFEGKVAAISPEIDATSRTVRVEATLANADEQLSPGMFVNVSVVAPEKTGVVAIPAMAIYYQPYGDTVFVAKETKDAKSGQTVKIAEQRFVKVGESHGDFVNILSGVKPGEEVVTTGAFKLSNGRKLFIDNSLAPKAELAPKPANT